MELPVGGTNDHLYMLRAADHMQPLVNGKFSYVPPLQLQIEQLTLARPIPDQLLDIFESIPVSYVTVHRAFLSADDHEAMQRFLDRGVAAGRLRFIKSFDGEVWDGVTQHNDLYAVTKPNFNSWERVRPNFPTIAGNGFSAIEGAFTDAGLLFMTETANSIPAPDTRDRNESGAVMTANHDPEKPVFCLLRLRRESLIILGFLALTVVMTALGRALRIRWLMRVTRTPTLTFWWDYHQTFHDPRHL